jgi:hypothetical protein
MNESQPPPLNCLSKEEVQRIKDEEHLRLLSSFHYIKGGVSCFFGLFGFFYIGFAFFMATIATTMEKAHPAKDQPPPALFFVLFGIIGGIMILFGLGLGIANIVSGRKIAQRRARTFSLVIATFNCLGIPYGTTLGIWTFLVLSRESVQKLYDKQG